MNGGLDMFTKEELLVINKYKLVAYNRKQKKLWLVLNNLKKILHEK